MKFSSSKEKKTLLSYNECLLVFRRFQYALSRKAGSVTDFQPLRRTVLQRESDEFLFTRQRSTFLEHCPAGTSGLVCCNYLVVTLISNCPMDCSYCFLQEYLANNPTLKVYTNVEDLLSKSLRQSTAIPHSNFVLALVNFQIASRLIRCLDFLLIWCRFSLSGRMCCLS